MKIRITILLLLLGTVGFSQDLNQGLLLHYEFNGNSEDSSGNENHGDPHNITYRKDRFGNPHSAARFNGINAYIDFPNTEALKVPLPVSFAFWVKYANANNYQTQTVFNSSFENDHCTGVWFNSTSSGNNYAVNIGDGTYDYTEGTRNTYVSEETIDSGEWHQVVVIVKGARDMQIFIDCEEHGGTYSGFGLDLAYSLLPGCIGRHDRSMSDPENYFKGRIDDFRYWNRALTAEDVTLLCSDAVLAVADANVPERQKFVVYPNPADSQVTIKTNLAGDKTVNIYNSFGKQVYSGAYSETIDVDDFAPGIYFVKLSNGQKTETQKMIIK